MHAPTPPYTRPPVCPYITSRTTPHCLFFSERTFTQCHHCRPDQGGQLNSGSVVNPPSSSCHAGGRDPGLRPHLLSCVRRPGVVYCFGGVSLVVVGAVVACWHHASLCNSRYISLLAVDMSPSGIVVSATICVRFRPIISRLFVCLHSYNRPAGR